MVHGHVHPPWARWMREHAVEGQFEFRVSSLPIEFVLTLRDNTVRIPGVNSPHPRPHKFSAPPSLFVLGSHSVLGLQRDWIIKLIKRSLASKLHPTSADGSALGCSGDRRSGLFPHTIRILLQYCTMFGPGARRRDKVARSCQFPGANCNITIPTWLPACV